MVDFSDIHRGDEVEITLLSNPTKQSKGEVFKILSAKPENTIVVLKNGDKGKIIQIINSHDQIKKRIMREDQHSENKEVFGEDIMRNVVIPQTIQSFLNSEGGYLYIGIKDTGELKERLIGLDYDFKRLNTNDKELPNDKLCDKLELQIMNSLGKYLSSENSIGSLIKINFPIINDVQIAEILIKKSTKPWFYKQITSKNKPKKFELHCGGNAEGERILDDFYIRYGGSKILLTTHEKFYKYVVSHFKS